MKADILVVGGGIAGITTATEAAEAGAEVILVEKREYIGGRVVQFAKYFPKLCPPSCGLEINLRRIRQNPNICVLTLAKIVNVERKERFLVDVEILPRYVKKECTGCGECEKACVVERPDDFNCNLSNTKAIYLHLGLYPAQYVVDSDYCTKCGACIEACRYNAIDLEQKPEIMNIEADSIVLATGYRPYDAERLDGLGFGLYKDVITNLMMERIAAPNGPTEGRILKPSDRKPPEKVAFVQCAGSRDENHLPYCSAVCCLASIKQALCIKEQCSDAEVVIFYIDIRAIGKYEDFYNRAVSEGVRFMKGKVGKITEENGKLIVEAEDVLSAKKIAEGFDLVVLAVGMVPENGLPFASYDDYGFSKEIDGVYPAGVAIQPMDVASAVQSAVSAAMRAIVR